jgi:hypothetical protein
MLSHTPPPPHTLHNTHRLTNAEAHAFLSTFLLTTTTDPSYRPDATLSSRGPISSSAGPSMPLPDDDATLQAGEGEGEGDATALGESNLTLANLRRIALGLRGVRVGGARFTTDKTSDYASNGKKRKRNDAQFGNSGNDNANANGGWEDKEAYEQAQHDIEQNETELQQPQLGAGNGEEVDGGDVGEVVETRPGEEDEGVDREDGVEGKVLSKEEKAERKKAKKAREKVGKRERNERRRKGEA